MLNNKYTLLYTFVSLFIFWIVIKYGVAKLRSNNLLIEGLTDSKRAYQKSMPYSEDTVINSNDVIYSRTVNLPINDPISCNNFCGPQAQCAITREQCTSDIDCQGCKPMLKSKEVSSYDASGKLGQQGLQYSPLTTGFNNNNADFAELYPGAKDAQLKMPYQGLDLWTKSFNEGLNLYNKTRESADKYNEGSSNATPLIYYQPKYQTTVSATGQFYETTPPASNSTLQQ